MIEKHALSTMRHPAVVHAAASELESDECTRLIRKLRWIGLDEEADRLQQAVRGRGPGQKGTVCAGPFSTD